MTSKPLPEISPDDDATILFTSGSTGESKGAVSTHRAVTTATYAYACGLMVLRELMAQDGRAPAAQPRTLLTVPLFHVTGEVPVMLNSFVIGRCMVMMPKWDATEALRLIEKEKITYFVGVPTMSLELMNHPDRHKYDLSSLTDITAGGAPRPVSHVERLREEFPNAQPALGYGLTETNAAGCANFWSNYAAKPASTGRAAEADHRACDPRRGDRHLGSGEIGEIGIRTAAEHQGLLAQSRRDRRAVFTADGYVRTGDVGYLDEDGYLFIVDRKKEIIIRGGENISAAEVEAECYACPSVAEAAVFRRARRAARRSAGGRHPREEWRAARRERASRLPRRQAGQVQDPRADHLLGRAAAAPRHRQDRPARAQGPIRALKLDRRTLLIGGGAGVGLVVAFSLWPRHLASELAVQRGRAGVRQLHQDRARRADHGRRAAGRDRPGHLDRAAADRRRRAWRGMGDGRGRAGAARQGAMPTRWRRRRAGRTDIRITAGSTSVRAFEQPMREAAAIARAMLVGAAADRWNVDPGECETADGFVINGGRTFTFGELAEEAADRSPPRDPHRCARRPGRG